MLDVWWYCQSFNIRLPHSRESHWRLQVQSPKTPVRKWSAAIEARTTDLWRESWTDYPLRHILQLLLYICL